MGLEIAGVGLRRELIAAGYTDRELRRERGAGRLESVRRGAYVGAGDVRLRQADGRHALLIQAMLPELAAGYVFSHGSAALLHGLPLWAVPLERVHLTRARRGGGRRAQTVHRHCAPLDATEIVRIRGVPVTSLARTVVDLSRVLPFGPAVALADAALREGLPRSGLIDAVTRANGWPGVAGARRVVEFADGRSESVGESRSRVALDRAGLPPPIPQLEVRVGGAEVARVDFLWVGQGTVGEFDGRQKYGRALRPGEDRGDVVFREKLREDRLRELGLEVVRWTWPELAPDRFPEVVRRLHRAFDRARARGFDARHLL